MENPKSEISDGGGINDFLLNSEISF